MSQEISFQIEVPVALSAKDIVLIAESYFKLKATHIKSDKSFHYFLIEGGDHKTIYRFASLVTDRIRDEIETSKQYIKEQIESNVDPKEFASLITDCLPNEIDNSFWFDYIQFDHAGEEVHVQIMVTRKECEFENAHIHL